MVVGAVICEPVSAADLATLRELTGQNREFRTFFGTAGHVVAPVSDGLSRKIPVGFVAGIFCDARENTFTLRE